MLMTDDAARELAGRMDVWLRFGGAPPSADDVAALVADWTEARAAIAHVIALHRQARAELAALEDRARVKLHTPGRAEPAGEATVHPIRRQS
jgi:hypothetical protein